MILKRVKILGILFTVVNLTALGAENPRLNEEDQQNFKKEGYIKIMQDFDDRQYKFLGYVQPFHLDKFWVFVENFPKNIEKNSEVNSLKEIAPHCYELVWSYLYLHFTHQFCLKQEKGTMSIEFMNGRIKGSFAHLKKTNFENKPAVEVDGVLKSQTDITFLERIALRAFSSYFLNKVRHFE